MDRKSWIKNLREKIMDNKIMNSNENENLMCG